MCDERERLIGYVYDECDDGERSLIDRHLASCTTCQDEIAGLRSTRQDLLAWEVPDHGSVWRPFVPARLTPWYREVPAWAMATAAGIVFMIGVGGAATGGALFKPDAASVSQSQSAAVQPVALSTTQDADAAALRAELNALEARMLAAVRANNAQFTQHVTTGSAERVAVMDSDDMLGNQVQIQGKDLLGLSRRLKQLEDRNSQLNSQVAALTAAMAAGGVPGR